MIGLGYIAFFTLYFGLTAWVVRLVRKLATEKTTATRLTVGIWVLSVGLMFWDVAPVYVVHRQLCAKDAGFVVYKTLEQWKVENPGVAEALSPTDRDRLVESGVTDRYQLNDRFFLDITREKYWHVINQREQLIVDSVTGDVLARYVDYYTNLNGIGQKEKLSDYKFWINIAESCEGTGNRVQQIQFNGFTQDVDTLGG